jgi:hypothetical protein
MCSDGISGCSNQSLSRSNARRLLFHSTIEVLCRPLVLFGICECTLGRRFSGPCKFVLAVLMQSSTYFAKWIVNMKCPKYITQFLKLEKRRATTQLGSVKPRTKPDCFVSSERTSDGKHIRTAASCPVRPCSLVPGHRRFGEPCCRQQTKINSMAFSPQANYTD